MPEKKCNTWTQLFMWSQAALAADIAELNFLAAITAAPRFWEVDFFHLSLFLQDIRGLWLTCTIGMNSFWIQASLLIRLTTDLPLIVAWKASGNWAVEILVHSGLSLFLTKPSKMVNNRNGTWVELWLPQMVIFRTSWTRAPTYNTIRTPSFF